MNDDMKGTTAPICRFLVAVLVVAAVLSASPAVRAHDELESSVPEHKAQFDDPISEVTINFGEPVGGVELALVGPDDRDVPGEVLIVSKIEAKFVFEPLRVEGEYFVRYLAEEDGHLIRGAITFVSGDRAGEGAGSLTWILFGLFAVLILAIGVFFSSRNVKKLAGGAEGGELTDVEV